MIFDHHLIIRSWEPNLNPEIEPIKRVAAWVRFPDILVEY